MLRQGVKNPNPKKSFMTGLSNRMEGDGKYSEIILMEDMNKCIGECGDLYNFVRKII